MKLDAAEATTSQVGAREPGDPTLAESREVLYRIFEFAPDAILLVDEVGRITKANAQTEKMFGFSRSELVGQVVEILIPERFAARHVSYRDGYLAAPHPRPMGVGVELFGRRKDGSEFPVDIMLSPLQTEDSRLALAVVRDITARKRVEIQARESQELFYRLFEFAPDAILVVETDGRIARANAKAQELFGHDLTGLIGQPVETLIPERYGVKHVEHRSRYIAEPQTRPMGAGLELHARRKDGTEFPVDIMLSPVAMQGGRLVLGVVRDITERRNAEAQARVALRRETLLKEIHHRVKNNLQVISSLLYLQSTHCSDPGTQDILKESQGRVKSIALIHEKLYRSDDQEILDFGGYVRDLLADLIWTYGIKPEEIAVVPAVEETCLGIDTAIPCGLMIHELVSNAFKHAFPGGMRGHVWVDVRADGPQRYTMRVQDDGVGLPSNLDWRAGATLGLQLVSDLAKQLEAEIEVDSGPGTTFRITFAEARYADRKE